MSTKDQIQNQKMGMKKGKFLLDIKKKVLILRMLKH